MTTAAFAPLPPYPSSHARSQLSHTQLASLNQKISLSVRQTLDLPTQTLISAAPAHFLSSYAQDVAQNTLDALIWDVTSASKEKPRTESSDARAVRAHTLLLAERLASTGTPSLDPITLLDLSIAYASHPTRLRLLFDNAFSTSPSLLASTTASALPAFTSLLGSHTTAGLHGLCKTAHAILCLLRVGPPTLLRAFAHSKDFVLALSQAYDTGLGTAAGSYGRLYLPTAGASVTVPHREPDDWEVLFLQTKVDLLDAFHILLTTLLNTLAAPPPSDPSSPAAQLDRAIDIVSALHALPAPPRRPDDHAPPTAFLNRSLLADYQHTYDLSEKLVRALPHGVVVADDARLEWLLAALRGLDADLDGGGSGSGPSVAVQARRRDPGAFELLLGSGAQPGIGVDDHATTVHTSERGAIVATLSRGAEAAAASSSKAVDPRVEEVRVILPDYAPEYVHALLQRADYGSVERVVEALLEGTAPPPEALQQQQQAALKAQADQAREEFEYTRDRRNVFDEEDMDVSRLRVGKKSDDAMTVLRDRSFMDQMKTDILRRVEAPTDSEDDEEVNIFGVVSDDQTRSKGKGKGRVREVAFDDELEDVGAVRVVGDGEESSADDEDEDGRDEEREMSPQTIVELAYIANPKVFERDAATRRSKERATLRTQTGWVDEQIEGFKIMLDRDPKLKERTLGKYEFSGNKPLRTGAPSPRLGSRSRSGTPDAQPARGRGEGGRGRRGQSRGRGRGRGRGATSAGGGSGDAGDAQGHARKDKNKARHANHDRKRGHDKKMGRAGGPSSGP
ncbi:hypothetical protein BC827DRAFT_1260123 [Russula dissimulans]|nr:hypothetical protein BC827DRAFT_1260123 [Russula dissimulans]